MASRKAAKPNDAANNSCPLMTDALTRSGKSVLMGPIKGYEKMAKSGCF
jgi:hypothetical protein